MLYFEMRFGAASGEATCSRCLAAIEPSAVRIEAAPGRWASFSDAFTLHPGCALDVDTRSFSELLARDDARFEQRDALAALAAARLESIEDRRDRSWSAVNGYGAGLAPKLGRDTPAPPLYPARDPQGRPRVRVSVHGTDNVLDSTKRASLWNQLRTMQAWSSPKREYVFVDGRHGTTISDPSQPTIGHVYATIAKQSSFREITTALWQHRALGFGPPLLWLLGIKQWKKTDANVLSVREHLASQCVEPDECPVLCAPRLDAAALDALVLALDEHLDGRELWFDGSQALAFATTIERDLHRGHEFKLGVLSSIQQLTRIGATDESKAVNERTALWLIERGRLREVDSLLVDKTHVTSAPFVAWFAAATANGAEKMQQPNAAEAIGCAMLAMFGAFDRENAVRAAIALFLAVENPPRFGRRLEHLREALQRLAVRDDRAAILEAINASPTEEHRRQLALLLTRIDGRDAASRT
ncbi:MAG: hypothetical protein JNK05_03540 [Myxococcales bacterium]|nr:hypothetical protein [Myxococcales bacterium]